MPDPLIAAACMPVTPAAASGVTQASTGPDADPFETILNAGLDERPDAAFEVLEHTAVAARPGTAPAGRAVAGASAAHNDPGDSRGGRGDEGSLDAFGALLVHAHGGAMRAPATAGATGREVSAPSAPPTETIASREAAPLGLTAIPAQPAMQATAASEPSEAIRDDAGSEEPTSPAALTGGARRREGGDTRRQKEVGCDATDAPTPAGFPGMHAAQDVNLAQRSAAAAASGIESETIIPAGEAARRTVRDAAVADTGRRKGTMGATSGTGTGNAKDTPGPAGTAAPDDQGTQIAREHPRKSAETVLASRDPSDATNPVAPGPPPTDRLAETGAMHGANRAPEPTGRSDAIGPTDALLSAGPQPPARGHAGPAQVVRVDSSLGSTGWQHEFGSQVSVLVSRREPNAEIRLNPPHLGPVQVRIGVQGDHVTLAFTAPQAETRAAIESALPQLRETFAANGLALGNASVSAESSGQQLPRDAYSASAPIPGEQPVAADAVLGPRRTMIVRLVDTYA